MKLYPGPWWQATPVPSTDVRQSGAAEEPQHVKRWPHAAQCRKPCRTGSSLWVFLVEYLIKELQQIAVCDLILGQELGFSCGKIRLFNGKLHTYMEPTIASLYCSTGC